MATSALDRALHLALFVVAAVAATVIALAVLERIGGDASRRTIRLVHIAIPLGITVLVALAERLYHAVT